jgi:hypothetical protein
MTLLIILRILKINLNLFGSITAFPHGGWFKYKRSELPYTQKMKQSTQIQQQQSNSPYKSS